MKKWHSDIIARHERGEPEDRLACCHLHVSHGVCIEVEALSALTGVPVDVVFTHLISYGLSSLKRDALDLRCNGPVALSPVGLEPTQQDYLTVLALVPTEDEGA